MPTTFDLWATAHLYGAHAPRGVVYLMVAFTALGSTWALLAVVPFLARRTTRRAAAFLLASLLMAVLVVDVGKELIARPRPFNAMSGISVLVLPAPKSPSFPSGHATKAFTAATFVALAYRASERSRTRANLVMIGGLLLAAAVALSRVFLGLHFPTDVVAGAIVGCALGLVGAYLLGRTTPTESGA